MLEAMGMIECPFEDQLMDLLINQKRRTTYIKFEAGDNPF